MITRNALKLLLNFGLGFTLIVLLTNCTDELADVDKESQTNTFEMVETSNRSSAFEQIIFGDYELDGCCVSLEVFTDYDPLVPGVTEPIHQIDVFDDNGNQLGSVFHGHSHGSNWLPNPDPNSPFRFYWVLEWCACDAGTYCFEPFIIGATQQRGGGTSNLPQEAICIEFNACSAPCQAAGLNYDQQNCLLSWEECPGWTSRLIGPNGQTVTSNPFYPTAGETGIYRLVYSNRRCGNVEFYQSVNCFNTPCAEITQNFIRMDQITYNCLYLVRAQWDVEDCRCCNYSGVEYQTTMEAFDGSGNSLGTHSYTQNATCSQNGISPVGYWNLNSAPFLAVCNFDIGETIRFIIDLEMIDEGDCALDGFSDTMILDYTVTVEDHNECEC